MFSQVDYMKINRHIAALLFQPQYATMGNLCICPT